MKIKIGLLSLLLLGGAALWIPKGPALPPGLTFAQINQPGSGGGAPSGAAGGSLAGTYPNPTLSNPISIPGGTSGTFTFTANSNGTQVTSSGNIISGAGFTASAGGLSSTLGNGYGAQFITTAGAAIEGFGQITELITLSTSGTTTDSAANLLPANSIIDAVVARVTTTITTATNWELGDATTAARFSSPNSTMTSGTTQVGLNHKQGSVSTDAAGPVQIAAAKLRITTTGTPGAGVIRVTVYYRQFTPPTS